MQPIPVTIVATLALLIMLLTGFTGLVYEVVWHKYLANLLGSQAQATATILAVFLGGLAVGYALFGRISKGRSPRFLLQTCGWAEVGIGLWALCFPLLFQQVWQIVGIISPTSATAPLLELTVAIILIGPPTILMGGTLPLLTQGLATNLENASRYHARIYAINTAGAFAGCLIAGFYFVPQLGLTMTTLAMALINLLAGASLLALGAFLSPLPAPAASDTPQRSKTINQAPDKKLALTLATAIAALCGFYALALQTALVRLTGIAMGSSEYAFAMVVAVFVCMLALGAWQVGNIKATRSYLVRNQLFLILAMIALHQTISYWPYLFHLVRAVFVDEMLAFYAYHAAAFLLLSLLLCLPVGLMGKTMPLLFSITKDKMGGLGANVGHLYFFNTLGCIVGAYFGGYVLLHWISLDQLFRICIVMSSATLALSLALKTRSHHKIVALRLSLVAAATVVATIMVPWQTQWLSYGLYRHPYLSEAYLLGPDAMYQEYYLSGGSTVFYEDGPNTTVAVIESRNRFLEDSRQQVSHSLMVNGKSDGSTLWGGSDRTTMLLSSHIPALLSASEHPRAAVVGFGTGVSVGALTHYPHIEKIDLIEISPAVRNAAPWFDYANHGVSDHPKVNWIIADAYRVLGATHELYNIILSEPSNPWMVGVERMFTQEFYELVYSKLAPGGLYAQWLQVYSLSTEAYGKILNTYASIFPYVHVFSLGLDTIILGSKEPITAQHFAKAESRLNNQAVRDELDSINLDSLAAVLGLELPLMAGIFSDHGLQHLHRPTLAHAAGKDLFLNRYADLLSLAQSVENIAWLNQAYDHVLLFKMFSEASSEQEHERLLMSAARGLCEMPEASLFHEWQNAREHCRQALIRLVQAGKIAKDEYYDPAYFNMVAQLSAKVSFPEIDVWDAKLYLDHYALLHSPILPLSFEVLHTLGDKCRSGSDDIHLDCRGAYIIALLVADKVSSAQQLYRELADVGYGRVSEHNHTVLRTASFDIPERALKDAGRF